jgi:hypothetical protein
MTTLHKILWAVFFFDLGMLCGFLLHIVMVNHRRIKAQKKGASDE